jgi:hypothetical protein
MPFQAALPLMLIYVNSFSFDDRQYLRVVSPENGVWLRQGFGLLVALQRMFAVGVRRSFLNYWIFVGLLKSLQSYFAWVHC